MAFSEYAFYSKIKKYIKKLDVVSNMSLDNVILRDSSKKKGKTQSEKKVNKVILKLALLNKKKSSKKETRLKKNIKGKTAANIGSLTRLLINKAVEKTKKTTKKDKSKEDQIIYSTKEERQIIINGGYGTVSKVYGAAPVVKYVNYDKLFSHLGLFKAKGMYEDIESSANTGQGESTREMVSTETADKAAKHFKYFVRGDVMGDVGYVPPTGANINSKEWEKYRMMSMMSIYRPIIKLKSITA